MPFGHKNAPAIFQKLMNELLDEFLYTICFVYIDDIVVFGPDESTCIANTKLVLSRLFDDNLKVNGLKCEFCLRKVEVLGHIICDGVLYPKVDRL